MKQTIADGSSHGYTMTKGHPSTRKAVASLYKTKEPIDVEHILINHGMNQGLLTSLWAFTNAGDEILVPEIGNPIF